MPTEGEWEYRKTRFVAESISGNPIENVCYLYRCDETAIGLIGEEEDARRIVTAVNCFDELVRLAEEYRKNRVEMRSMSGGWPELQQGKYQAEIARIDAVLAKAKGNP